MDMSSSIMIGWEFKPEDFIIEIAPAKYEMQDRYSSKTGEKIAPERVEIQSQVVVYGFKIGDIIHKIYGDLDLSEINELFYDIKDFPYNTSIMQRIKDAGEEEGKTIIIGLPLITAEKKQESSDITVNHSYEVPNNLDGKLGELFTFLVSKMGLTPSVPPRIFNVLSVSW